MKFFTYALLVCGASAISLKQMIASDKEVTEVTKKEWEELGDALYSYTADGESLSFPEMKEAVVTWAKKHDVEPFKGWEKALKHVFDMVDTNGDGEVSRAEADKAADEMDSDEEVQLKALVTDPTKEQWTELGTAIWDATEGDNTLEKGELVDLVGAWAKKHGFDLPADWKEWVGKAFDYVDANSDGHVTRDELQAAFEKHEDDMDVQLTSTLKSTLKLRDPSEEQWKELGVAIYDATAGDNTLEKDELIGLVKAWAEKHGFKPPKGWKKEVGKVFDYVDANSDGHVTRAELQAAFEKHEDDMDVQLTSTLKSTLKLRDPSEEQWKELGTAIWDATAGDNTLEKHELIGLVKAWAEKHGFKPPKGWRRMLKKVFDYVDANSDGHVTRAELQAAFEKHEEDMDVQLAAKVASGLTLGEPTDAQWKELGMAIWDSTEGDNTLEEGELIDLIGAWAGKHDIDLPDGWKDWVSKAFDYVDANDDGHVTRDELVKAMKEHK